MARNQNQTAPATANADGTTAAAEKPKRVNGPRSVFIVFKPGTTSEQIAAVRDVIGEVTMSRNTVFKKIELASQSGEAVTPFMTFTVKVDPKGGDDE